MSKRPATDPQAESSNGFKKPFLPEGKNVQEMEMGEFEDGWEDEFESDEEVVDGAKDEGAYTDC